MSIPFKSKEGYVRGEGGTVPDIGIEALFVFNGDESDRMTDEIREELHGP